MTVIFVVEFDHEAVCNVWITGTATLHGRSYEFCVWR
jgi:hypothetical protein